MDPHQQQLNQLDPKLKEAYEKVMNGDRTRSPLPTNPDLIGANPLNPPGINPPIAPPVTTPSASPSTVSSDQIVSGSMNPPSIIKPNQPTPTGAGWTPPVMPSPIATPFDAPAERGRSGSSAPPVSPTAPAFGAHGFVAKKRGTISPILILIGIIVFLAVYTLFWLKFFNIKVPFLP